MCSTVGKAALNLKKTFNLTKTHIFTGYGNISPTTNISRFIMLIYSVIGVPMSGILFAYLGEMYGSTVGYLKPSK